MCSCRSIPECCVMLSGIKLSMGSFVLFGLNTTDFLSAYKNYRCNVSTLRLGGVIALFMLRLKN